MDELVLAIIGGLIELLPVIIELIMEMITFGVYRGNRRRKY